MYTLMEGERRWFVIIKIEQVKRNICKDGVKYSGVTGWNNCKSRNYIFLKHP